MKNMAMSQLTEQEYVTLNRFAEEHETLPYHQFDSATIQTLNLFVLPEEKWVVDLEEQVNHIISALPAFQRILAKPITRLKDVANVLPIEAVRVINNATMGHIAIHTELWGNVTKDGLKPRKLMTLSNEEDYRLYENLAFAKLIDAVLAFARQNARMLRDILYSYRPLRYNFLERTNHLMHFLAIGKLHVGYAHSQEGYHVTHQRCLEKLLYVEKFLKSRLRAPVYQHCKKYPDKIALKQTNIFRLQKDYRRVYLLLKQFSEREREGTENFLAPVFPESGYAQYCTMLSVFAAGHFNFEFSPAEGLNFRELDATCNYKKWAMNLKRVSVWGVEGLLFKVKKEKIYKICLIFYRSHKYEDFKLRAFQRKYAADEYLFVDPVDDRKRNHVYLNLYDISSFRRIQQFILRAMIYADEKREICPFCGASLHKEGEECECTRCRTHIQQKTCSETGKSYFTNDLKGYKIPLDEEELQNSYFAEKRREEMLFFRNITPIDEEGNALCPHCGGRHDE